MPDKPKNPPCFLEHFRDMDKSQPLRVETITLDVDWDDVDHEDTARTVAKICKILNAHWDDPQYALPDKPIIPRFRSDKAENTWWDKRYEQAKEIMCKLIGE